MGAPLSNKLQVQEYLNSANISNDDVDYYLNITGLLWPEIRTGQEDYCGIPIQRIRSSFQLAHGCLSLIICLVGVVVNILNIVVLSQKELRRNNINRILCSLAVADFLLMSEYIPFTCHMYLFPQRSLDVFYSYPWAVFVLFHAHFTLVSNLLTLTPAHRKKIHFQTFVPTRISIRVLLCTNSSLFLLHSTCISQEVYRATYKEYGRSRRNQGKAEASTGEWVRFLPFIF